MISASEIISSSPCSRDLRRTGGGLTGEFLKIGGVDGALAPGVKGIHGGVAGDSGQEE
jgi:hypothetical protein